MLKRWMPSVLLATEARRPAVRCAKQTLDALGAEDQDRMHKRRLSHTGTTRDDPDLASQDRPQSLALARG
jgi:hypothetical protein